MTKKDALLALGVTTACFFCCAVSWHVGKQSALRDLAATSGNLRETESGYRYIRPLLACDALRDFESSAYTPLKTELESYIETQKRKGAVSEVSLYYRELGKGQWMAINGEADYHPASLFKIPNMMAVLREEDLGRDILAKTYTVDPKTNPVLEQAIPPERMLNDYQTYTVDDLLQYMIVYSDNRANHALDTLGDPVILQNVFSDFGIDLAYTESEGYLISPKEYALLLRGLYNATYLSRTLSEKALAYLAQADFTDGLGAGLPSEITLAHKFGNYVGPTAEGEIFQELHDCGIVYTPHSDYVLCVMTRGSEVSELTSTVTEISDLVYQATIAGTK